jgi:hypothetical protein
MDTEQPATDSDIHDRMLAALTPEGPSEVDEVPQEAPQAIEADADTETTETAEVPDLVDFADDDGTVHKIPKALEGKIPLRAEFTRKTQEAARLAEVSQDRLHFAEVRERFNEAFSQKGGEVQALKHQLAQLENLNPAVYGGDQTALWQHFQNMKQLQDRVRAGEQELNTWNSQFGAVAKQHSERQWGLAVNAVKERIGAFTPGEDVAMANQVQALGFTDAEIKGRFADPRVLHAVYKAAKWDALQAQKGKSLEAAKAAPPVLKPGASKGPGAAVEQKSKDARARLKSSGKLEDAARVFLLRG